MKRCLSRSRNLTFLRVARWCVLAGALKSNLDIPPAVAKFLSLYLLMALA